jgi:hypothetical protein
VGGFSVHVRTDVDCVRNAIAVVITGWCRAAIIGWFTKGARTLVGIIRNTIIIRVL